MTPVNPDAESWRELIDRTLIDWGARPEQFDDEDVPPSAAMISMACTIARTMCDFGAPAPTRIIPDSCGGIVFEDDSGDIHQTIRISADGEFDHTVVQNFQIIYRFTENLGDD